MKKMTLADKLAKKAFESPAIQKSWQVHMQAFGPILEPAFADDYQTRTHLCAALNFISNRDLEKGLKKLQPLQEKCKTDADKAAWLFCMGLVFDMAGVQDAMVDCYMEAAELGHRFYLPYLKVAKYTHSDRNYNAAACNYREAILCLTEKPRDAQANIVLASAYINLASCLTSMHCFDEALEMLGASEQLIPVFPGRSATSAVLYAALGQWEQADAALNALEQEAPTMFAETKKMVEDIRQGVHPHFFSKEIDGESVEGFWQWFAAEDALLTEEPSSEQLEAFFGAMQTRLREVFPFLEGIPYFTAEKTEKGYLVRYNAFYMTALRGGYERLFAACPEELKLRWEFEIVD